MAPVDNKLDLLILNFLGITELGTVATLQKKGHNSHDSCGLLCYDLNLKVIDLNTKMILGPNERGEIILKQEYMMKQYFNNPEATKEVIDKDGNIHNKIFLYTAYTKKYVSQDGSTPETWVTTIRMETYLLSID